MNFKVLWNSNLFASFLFVLLIAFGYFVFHSLYFEDWKDRYLLNDVLHQKDLGCSEMVLKKRINSESQYDLKCSDNSSLYKPLNFSLP